MDADTSETVRPVGLWETLAALARARPVLLTIALLSAVFSAQSGLRASLTPPDLSIHWREDCDIVMLKQGIDETPRLRDTLKWWTGQWIGCNPFWRPLSSYAFWSMWRVFGWEQHDRFLLVVVVCHLICAVWMFLLVQRVTGRGLVACLAVVLCNMGLGIGAYDLVDGDGFRNVGAWIYAPDVWLAMCVLPALWAAWGGRLWWAVLFAAMAAGFKETGFVVFPLVGALYWWRFRRWHHALGVLVALAALMAAVRLVFVGPGWILGSNRWMLWRMYLVFAGEPLTMLAGRRAPHALIGIALAVTIVGWRSRWLRYGALPLGVAAAALAAWLAATNAGLPVPYVVSLCQVLDWRWIGAGAVGVAAWVVGAYAGMRGPDRVLIVLFVLAYWVLALPATIAPQTGIRSLYTAFMMSGAAQALCLWAVALAVVRTGREWLCGPRGENPGGTPAAPPS